MTDIKSMTLPEMTATLQEHGGAGVPGQAGLYLAAPGRHGLLRR